MASTRVLVAAILLVGLLLCSSVIRADVVELGEGQEHEWVHVEEDHPQHHEEPAEHSSEFGEAQYEANVPPHSQPHGESRQHVYDTDSAHHDMGAMTLSKEEQLAVYEEDLVYVRQHEVEPALSRVARLSQARQAAKQSSSWIPSSEERQRIYAIEQELNAASQALVAAQNKELAIKSKMKPLWGIVSYQFMQEQQVTIKECIGKVSELAYHQAWWQSLFNARAESFTDLIVQFVLQWIMSYIMMYPFAAAYYAFWAAPWSVYSYSSSYQDLFVGFIAWLLSVIVMILPLVALGVTGYFVVRKYGPELQRRADEHRRQQEAAREAYGQQAHPQAYQPRAMAWNTR
jgi:hypothetical protein